MALTITKVYAQPVARQDRFENVVAVAADTSYLTGGWSLTKNDLGFANTVDPEFDVEPRCQGGYIGEYDHTNEKLKLFYGDNNNAADGPLIEVPNATNVSAAVTALRVRATGKWRM